MKPTRGYYRLIQFCPDASRLEAVNVGVVLFCPDTGFLAARTAAGNQRAEKIVERGTLDKAALNSAKRAIERRLEVDRDAFQNLDDLQRFVATRGNALKLTDPRPVKVFDPQQDLGSLFNELVGGRARSQARTPVAPELDSVFHRLHDQGRARLDWEVNIPVVGRTLRVPYAYRNGDWNLVKPQRFSSIESSAINTAMRLALEGDLLQRHSTDEEGAKRLIVVSLFREADDTHSLTNRVSELLDEYHVRTVKSEEIAQFIAQVECEARWDSTPCQ
jgi:hypothetical protein